MQASQCSGGRRKDSFQMRVDQLRQKYLNSQQSQATGQRAPENMIVLQNFPQASRQQEMLLIDSAQSRSKTNGTDADSSDDINQEFLKASEDDVASLIAGPKELEYRQTSDKIQLLDKLFDLSLELQEGDQGAAGTGESKGAATRDLRLEHLDTDSAMQASGEGGEMRKISNILR